jgi:hypothetical protein
VQLSDHLPLVFDFEVAAESGRLRASEARKVQA